LSILAKKFWLRNIFLKANFSQKTFQKKWSMIDERKVRKFFKWKIEKNSRLKKIVLYWMNFEKYSKKFWNWGFWIRGQKFSRSCTKKIERLKKFEFRVLSFCHKGIHFMLLLFEFSALTIHITYITWTPIRYTVGLHWIKRNLGYG